MAALDAGGRIVDDSEAPEQWTLADGAGNRVCIAHGPTGPPCPHRHSRHGDWMADAWFTSMSGHGLERWRAWRGPHLPADRRARGGPDSVSADAAERRMAQIAEKLRRAGGTTD